MAPVRSLTTLLLPGGVLVLVGLILFRPGVLTDTVQPYLHAYPYLVFGVGAVLGWYFNRSRVVFGLLVLTVATVALACLDGEGVAPDDVAPLVFDAAAVLLPLNLVLYARVKERGLFTAHGATRIALIAAQVLAVDLTLRFEWSAPKAWLAYAVLDQSLMAWTTLPQTGLAAFGLAAIVLMVRCVRRRDPIDAGYLWTSVAALAALHGSRWGWVPATFLATGGLALIWALVETTYRMAYYDELTGLPGRRALNEALLQVGSRYAVAMVDIDHFKRFNDVFGHDVGDQALRLVAARLSGITGGGKAFRYGGEEFVVFFSRASAAEAFPHLEAARRAVADSSFILRGPRRPRRKPKTPKPGGGPHVSVSLTVSIGLAEPDERKNRVSPQQVLKAADKALYRAKNAGRNRLMV